MQQNSAFLTYHERNTWCDFHIFAEGVLASEKYHLGSLAYLRSIGVSLASCGVLEELRIKTIDPLHFVADLEELLPTLPNTTNLSRIVLDADQRARGKLTENCRETLDAVLVECAERISAERNNRRLTVQLCTEKEGQLVNKMDGRGRLSNVLYLFRKLARWSMYLNNSLGLCWSSP